MERNEIPSTLKQQATTFILWHICFIMLTCIQTLESLKFCNDLTNVDIQIAINEVTQNCLIWISSAVSIVTFHNLKHFAIYTKSTMSNYLHKNIDTVVMKMIYYLLSWTFCYFKCIWMYSSTCSWAYVSNIKGVMKYENLRVPNFKSIFVA